MRVLICGGRDFSDRDLFSDVLNDLSSRTPFLHIIQGGAPGADALAREWCEKWRVSYDNYPADWKTHGRAAGPIRNQRMIDRGRPELVIAFAGGRGTADMVSRARKAGIEVREVVSSSLAARSASGSKEGCREDLGINPRTRDRA